jgi:hypothetical protein
MVVKHGTSLRVKGKIDPVPMHFDMKPCDILYLLGKLVTSYFEHIIRRGETRTQVILVIRAFAIRNFISVS